VAWVTVGLGSSIDPVEQLKSCLDALLLSFQDLSLSSVFESESIGFDGDNFLNMVVGFETEIELSELFTLLKTIEDKSGRDRSQPRFSSRKLDIDLLTYGNLHGEFSGITLPRAEVTENAFVLWPLSQINGNAIHPQLGLNYKALWNAYDKSSQNLWPVDFKWHGRAISKKGGRLK
jgi:2-amino-4-hydroxy-6-hydroxymethyldihydropteridine diphosphokinase